METMKEEYLKMMLKKAVHSYYDEMVNNAVVSFGGAGSRILNKIMPLEIRKTVYKSVQRKNENPFRNYGNENEIEGYIDVVGPEPIEVGLVSRNDVFGFRGRSVLNLEKPRINVEELIVNFNGAKNYAKRLAQQVFSEMEKTSSFVLISGFGGTFAQNIHLEFSDLLSKMAIAHLNIVVVPSKAETNRRRLAQKGLRYLAKQERRVIPFDNEKYFSTKKPGETDIIDSIESVNEKIARLVEVSSMRMSEVSDTIKYYLCS